MRTLAIKQLNHAPAKHKKKGDRVRSRPVSPLSTGMPLLQRQCACGGGCPRCQEKLGIKTQLKISEPGDKYEQEADRIADEVMRMPDTSIQRQDNDSISQTKRDYEPCAELTDPKDFSILIANHYLSTELNFWTNPIFSSVDCHNDYVCFVNYNINTINTTIRVELDSLPRTPGGIVSAVLNEPHSRECSYRYTCPRNQKVVFTKVKCFQW